MWGRDDQSIPQETIEKRQAACKAAGKTCEFAVYPDAPHGFDADYRPSYRADAAKDGWARLLAWFKDERGRRRPRVWSAPGRVGETDRAAHRGSLRGEPSKRRAAVSA